MMGLILFFSLLSVVNSTDVNSCQTIGSSGYYRLTANIVNYGGTCFTLNANMLPQIESILVFEMVF